MLENSCMTASRSVLSVLVALVAMLCGVSEEPPGVGFSSAYPIGRPNNRVGRAKRSVPAVSIDAAPPWI
jgi:hypothetical protein